MPLFFTIASISSNKGVNHYRKLQHCTTIRGIPQFIFKIYFYVKRSIQNSELQIKKSMRGEELQMSRIRAGVIRYSVYKDHDVLVDEVNFPEGGKCKYLQNQTLVSQSYKIRFGISDLDYVGIHYFTQVEKRGRRGLQVYPP